ncbi:MAG: CheY-like chemotaxis protein [Candidatus Azotimanducaceae bacterium]|jgi:CheY-like chemotaxis protein
MNGVIGMTSLLRETELTMQQENFLETIRNSGESLLTIINEILDFSKLDASQVQLEQQAFDLEVCASEAMDIIFPTAAAKGIELLLDYKVHSSRLWIGDATRIRQVMVNLLSNAVKFTEAGQIIVTVRGDNQAFDDSNDAEKTEHEDNAKLHFEIEDSGIGITPLQLETLFDPFIQADVSTTRKYGGTGLGLSICKGLIELMGGQITTISSPGRGSIFKFDLYLKTSRNKVRELTNSYPGKRAVIIHDKVASLENLKRYLELVNVTVEGHHSLDSFIKSLDELNRNTEQNIYPDVIFTNQQVSTHDAEKLSCPILSIAAKQFSDQGGAAVASPMRLPIRPTELASLLSQVFISQNKIEVSQPSPKKVWDDLPIQGKSFLLAEDNVVNQQVAVQFLSKLGIRVDVVSNGKEAVEMMYQRNYDYIFMDLQMPEIDGLEATQLIRQMELPVQPYIIAMTANAMAEDKQVCLDIGMNDFISKPVRLDDMHSTLKQALNQTLNNHGDQLH